MSAAANDWTTKVNLTGASVLAMDTSAQGLTVLDQILKGFAVGKTHLCSKVDEARRIFETEPLDLIIVDAGGGNGDGAKFLAWARRSSKAPNNVAPMIATMGHVQKATLENVRDCGANFILTKPVRAEVLMQRIQWIARENRPFIESPKYVGPDRRYKNVGPPPGKQGRRADDLSLKLGEAHEPNMSQDDIDFMMKPQKVAL